MPIYRVTFKDGTHTDVMAAHKGDASAMARKRHRGGAVTSIDDAPLRSTTKQTVTTYIVKGGAAAGFRTKDEAEAKRIVAKHGGKIKTSKSISVSFND